jgi:predicted GH43/DUF377 family glycosyl hydrolase
MNAIVRRSHTEIHAHPARVISRAFDPGQEGLIRGLSRAQAVTARVLAMDEEEVARTLAETLAAYSNRHDDLRATFRKNFELVATAELLGHPDYSQERAELIGSYFTQEYSIEGAALFNPSIVEAPDQSGCGEGELRFIMSLRAVGEGHISSIEFRSGILGAQDSVALDAASTHLSTGERSTLPTTHEYLSPRPVRVNAPPVEIPTASIDDGLTAQILQEALHATAPLPSLSALDAATEVLRRIVDASYQLEFSATSTLSERVLFPGTPAESHGLEDARFVRFVEDDGEITYFATYTAYDGANVAPHLLQTDDFLTFRMRPMFGEAARNKGVALFPRRIDGVMWCLSRWDRENISVAQLESGIGWSNAKVVQTPTQPWELIQLGPCSSPIETPEGWLVLTHGVGPMRTYAIGALLLDLQDPSVVIGVLEEPLLIAAETERNGYVPNVVYSCGALIHNGSLVLPYGCSDASVRFAFVDMTELLAGLHGSTEKIEVVSS